MTTSSRHGDERSGATLSCLTGAIVLREGARAVGSTFATEWDSDARPPAAPTPSSRAAPAPVPLPSAAAVAPQAQPTLPPESRSQRSKARQRSRSLPWSPIAAFALGATIAAAANLVVERGGLEVAALASAVAAGTTFAAALTRVVSKGHAGRRGQ